MTNPNNILLTEATQQVVSETVEEGVELVRNRLKSIEEKMATKENPIH